MKRNDDSDPGVSALLEAARRGDEAALGRLLESYRSYLRLLARLDVGHHLQSKIDASDLVQETFSRAVQAFGGFRGVTEAELLAWLRRILASRLSNAVRHYCGTARRDVNIERELNRSSAALQGMLALSQTSPSQRAIRREHAVLLASAVERLPDDYRDVIFHRHIEGLPFGQVARRMNRTPGSVEKLWARALAALRRELEDSL